MKTNYIKFLMIVLLMFLTSVVSAKELKSDELNYVVTIPSGWTIVFQNQAGFSIASPDRKNTVILLIQKAGFSILNSNSIARFERDLIKAGSTKISSKNFVIDGVPAYQTIFGIGKVPFTSSFIDRLIIANNKLYNLQAMHDGGDIDQDPYIQEILTSFHFLQPPKPPIDSFWGRFGSFVLKSAIFIVVIVIIFVWARRKSI